MPVAALVLKHCATMHLVQSVCMECRQRRQPPFVKQQLSPFAVNDTCFPAKMEVSAMQGRLKAVRVGG